MESVIQDLIRKQRPYYLPQGNPIKGIEGQYWYIFKHRNADRGPNLLKSLVSMLSFNKGKHPLYKLIRLDLVKAKVYVYTPRQDSDVPSLTLLRTAKPEIIQQFLTLESTSKETRLLEGSFREIKGRKRKYSLPDQLKVYNKLITEALERSILYRRSTAYFDSGVLKLYEEPLQDIVRAEGKIHLLMDWQGFTKRADVVELERLHDPSYRAKFAQLSLQEFLQGLSDSDLTGTEIMAELVRLGCLQIRLVRMERGKGIYHKKTGILSDRQDNHILHEGSDNFTRAAHSKNAEGVTFLYSWESSMDAEAIADSIQQFDAEWIKDEFSFDLTEEFLQQVLKERERRTHQTLPTIEAATPEELITGETTEVVLSGHNLSSISKIEVADDKYIKISILNKTQTRVTTRFQVKVEHPPQPITELDLTTPDGTFTIDLPTPIQILKTDTIPDFEEIEEFKTAIEMILAGQHGPPNDFLYWMAQQRPQQFKVERSDLLNEMVDQGILFEHQKSGAQHCLRVMRNFGVAVCADAVGLGKTRLAAAIARLSREQNGHVKVAVIAARKLHANWEREMGEVGFRTIDFELYNKNLMSRKGNGFLDDFNRYGGPDLVIIDEAHEGIRNYKNRIHRMCLQIRERDQRNGRQRNFLLLTATPWNNRREDIYNILSPFLTRPEGFTELGFPPELVHWFQNREVGVEPFTDDSSIFRRIYRELFLQRTRQMLRDAMPDLNVYPHRRAEWLPVEFETETEEALEIIFSRFETDLYIPFADPVRFLNENPEQRSLLQNQRRFFLQRAESSMYALKRTIFNFRGRIEQMKKRLLNIESTADGLRSFLLIHYGFESETDKQSSFDDLDDKEAWEEDYEEEEEDEDEIDPKRNEKRQQLRRTIELTTERLQNNPVAAQNIYQQMFSACDNDLRTLDKIQDLLADEFVKDHKREQVTQKVKELTSQGHKVLLISTFSDTVLNYYRYMSRDTAIANRGIGMAIGSTKQYFPDNSDQLLRMAPHNIQKGQRHRTGIKRQELFRLFAPAATCKMQSDRPAANQELMVLIGSETLSVGQNLQDADYLINIDLPWNPMVLEQRIGRIDRPKQHQAEFIYVYYANSESQLLRQASRLSNLNKKLVGTLATSEGQINPVTTPEGLSGPSIYGDTLFDDAILPGYVDFLESLVKARQMEQESLQESVYTQQETTNDLYTQQEILFSEDVSQRLQEMGDDYKANPIALGRKTGELDEPIVLAALTLEYFGPNGEAILDKTETVFWNDQTKEKNAYGVAIATAVKTPKAGDVFSAKYLLNNAKQVYNSLVTLKKEKLGELDQIDNPKNIGVTSERLNRIQMRINQLSRFPEGITRSIVKDTLKKLNGGKHRKNVQKILKDYTDGEKAKLEGGEFLSQLIEDTDYLNLLLFDEVKATSLKISIAALLMRA
jgi:SNF2 family DNA or RNA helicase